MNIYKILEALKGVEESVMSEIDQLYHEWLNSEYAPFDSDSGDDRILTQKAAAFLRGTVAPEHIDIYAQEMARAFDGGLTEGGYPFAGQAVGQKPGDQVRGTEKAKKTSAGAHPFKGRLVGASESVEMECGNSMSLTDKLKARWEETKRAKGLQEYGMTTGGTSMGGGTEPANPADLAKQTSQVQQNVNKLKAAGANIPNVGQAVQSVIKDPAAPANQQDKNISAGLGQEIDQVLTKGDPSTVNQLATLIKKVKGV